MKLFLTLTTAILLAAPAAHAFGNNSSANQAQQQAQGQAQGQAQTQANRNTARNTNRQSVNVQGDDLSRGVPSLGGVGGTGTTPCVFQGGGGIVFAGGGINLSAPKRDLMCWAERLGGKSAAIAWACQNEPSLADAFVAAGLCATPSAPRVSSKSLPAVVPASVGAGGDR